MSHLRIFVKALEQFLRDYQDRQLSQAINQAVKDAPPDKAEREQLRYIRQHQRRMVEHTW
ncbi:MAG: hypothetical protein HY741_19195 [Chloroflexi bacterium]|nr:hypothetical protein [Chloroflexota bacterium]